MTAPMARIFMVLNLNLHMVVMLGNLIISLGITHDFMRQKGSRSPLNLNLNLKVPFKGILHQKIFYRLNHIFWIVMGCGIIARFGRKGLKTTET